MPLPKEFNFSSEAEFITAFLQPLLQRLGFLTVIPYHGTREYGKDVIVGEIDQFGHPRYHGIQAKYLPSISLGGIETVITDAKQAFAAPFQHPQTGAHHRISNFYVVNGGTFSPQATQHFYASLESPFGGSVQLIDGPAILLRDRSAARERGENVNRSLDGIFVDVIMNSDILPSIRTRLELVRDDHPNATCPSERCRNAGTSSYLARPFALKDLPVDQLIAYVKKTEMLNTVLAALILPNRPGTRKGEVRLALECVDDIEALKAPIVQALTAFKSSSGPMVPV
jgi:hypothetical protein